ncbi:MAG: hypothetical protein ACRD1E_05350, partial [Terriglobales bacterium]
MDRVELAHGSSPVGRADRIQACLVGKIGTSGLSGSGSFGGTGGFGGSGSFGGTGVLGIGGILRLRGNSDAERGQGEQAHGFHSVVSKCWVDA